MIINVKLKVFFGVLMIWLFCVFEISFIICKICGNNSIEKFILEFVLKVLYYNGIYSVF